MSNRKNALVMPTVTLVAAALLSGCAATTAIEPKAAKADSAPTETLKPGVRVISREEIEAVNGQHDLARALSILVPGLTVRGH
jgi:hypothetical protein